MHGACYESDHMIARDQEQACQWYWRGGMTGTAHGSVGGMWRFGVCLMEGRGVGKDEGEGSWWLSRASEGSGGCVRICLDAYAMRFRVFEYVMALRG